MLAHSDAWPSPCRPDEGSHSAKAALKVGGLGSSTVTIPSRARPVPNIHMRASASCVSVWALPSPKWPFLLSSSIAVSLEGGRRRRE